MKSDSLDSAIEGTFALEREPSETLVIHCADPRFRPAFQEFVGKAIGIDRHTLISLAGGAGPFVLSDPESDLAKQMIDQLRLFIEGAGMKNVVALNHTDCKWYAKTFPDDNSHKITERQIADLQRFARMIHNEFAEVSVRTFLAVLDDKNVRFKRIPLG
ncbi:MAG: hypothetical protein ACE5GA_04730 [Candidatus Zixiibacteriota bacterium]